MSPWVNFIVIGWMSVAFIYGFPMGNENLMDSVIKHTRKARNVENEEDDTIIQTPPRFLYIRKSPPESEEVQLQNKIVLECEAAGSPAPSIHWLKNGHPVRQDSYLLTNDLPEIEGFSEGLSTTKSRLFIDCMSPSDEALYTCVAKTIFQRISITTNVYLSSGLPTILNPSCLPPKNSLTRISHDEPARIHMWSTRLLQNIGTDAILFCRVTGTPNLTVKWSVNGEELSRGNERYRVMRNGDLLIRKINWNDMGEYTCMAGTGDNVDDSVNAFLYPMANEDTR